MQTKRDTSYDPYTPHMIKLSKNMFYLAVAGFILLLIRDHIVYPAYPLAELCFVSFIRLAVLILTVYVTSLFRPDIWKQKIRAALYSIVWICIVPHSFYNTTQIRHIAELCRLPAGGHFAGECNSLLWTILPLLLYSIGSLIIFLYCVNYIARYIPRPYVSFFLSGTFTLVSMGAVIGIYSRIDSFLSLLWNTKERVALLGSVMTRPDFWYNVVAYAVFAHLVYALWQLISPLRARPSTF